MVGARIRPACSEAKHSHTGGGINSSGGFSIAMKVPRPVLEHIHTVDGRNPAPPWLKPYKEWDKLAINWCMISSIHSISN